MRVPFTTNESRKLQPKERAVLDECIVASKRAVTHESIATSERAVHVESVLRLESEPYPERCIGVDRVSR